MKTNKQAVPVSPVVVLTPNMGFLATLAGRRCIISATTGEVICEANGKAITLAAEEANVQIVARAVAIKEAKLSYERAWAKEHTPPSIKKEAEAKAKAEAVAKVLVPSPEVLASVKASVAPARTKAVSKALDAAVAKAQARAKASQPAPAPAQGIEAIRAQAKAKTTKKVWAD